MERDDLDEEIAKRTARNPECPQLLEAAMRARTLIRGLTSARVSAGLTQAGLARKMGTSQSAIARMERCERDPRLSTVTRYAQFVGQPLELV